MNATILLVDDDAGMLLLCRRFLEQTGHTVLQAPGSSEALKLYAEHPGAIDLIVSDVLLPPPVFQLSPVCNPFPRVNGLDLVNRFLDSHRDIRILVMSSTAKDDLVKQGLLRADLPFIQKPFTAEAFRALVQQTLAAQPPTRPQLYGTTKKVDWAG